MERISLYRRTRVHYSSHFFISFIKLCKHPLEHLTRQRYRHVSLLRARDTLEVSPRSASALRRHGRNGRPSGSNYRWLCVLFFLSLAQVVVDQCAKKWKIRLRRVVDSLTEEKLVLKGFHERRHKEVAFGHAKAEGKERKFLINGAEKSGKGYHYAHFIASSFQLTSVLTREVGMVGITEGSFF